jgi:anaerobic ribonucleoside-triphosphate reductase activating protein
MIKFKDSYIVFEEIPDRVSLAINITNCQNNCVGCHSPELRLNNGEELTEKIIDKLIKENYGIDCFLFMGEGKDKGRLLELVKYIKHNYNLKVAIYSGRNNVEFDFYEVFDYIKVGEYKEEYGPLNKETTNQRLYEIGIDGIKDITYKFWKNSSR